jgi:hypothetical protein
MNSPNIPSGLLGIRNEKLINTKQKLTQRKSLKKRKLYFLK